MLFLKGTLISLNIIINHALTLSVKFLWISDCKSKNIKICLRNRYPGNYSLVWLGYKESHSLFPAPLKFLSIHIGHITPCVFLNIVAIFPSLEKKKIIE